MCCEDDTRVISDSLLKNVLNIISKQCIQYLKGQLTPKFLFTNPQMVVNLYAFFSFLLKTQKKLLLQMFKFISHLHP